MGGAGKGANVAFTPGKFRNDKRIVVNNIIYIANLIALKQWYDQVRTLFISSRFPRALLEALQEKVDLAIGERINRLEAVCLKKPADVPEGRASKTFKLSLALYEHWPELKEFLQAQPGSGETAGLRDQFIGSVHQGISASGREYIRVIQGLDPADSAKGTRWLQGIIADIMTASEKILPSIF